MENYKTFTIEGDYESGTVWVNGARLEVDESLRHSNHSPDGFSWGYGGSGPAQLALALMLSLFGHAKGYQELKWKVVANLPKSDFILRVEWDDATDDGKILNG